MGANDEREENKADDEPALSPLTPPSSLNKEEEEVASQAHVNAASGGQEVQPQLLEKQTVDGCLEGGEEDKEKWSGADIKGTKNRDCDCFHSNRHKRFINGVSFCFSAESKQRRELIGPEAKRSRSASPCVTADCKLPPFKPNNPLGGTHTTNRRILNFYFKSA